MKLSKNFSLKEMLVTSTGIENIPTEKEINNMKLLVDNILQPLRDYMGIPIIVTSGFRCKAVNDAVGGSKTSGHTRSNLDKITESQADSLLQVDLKAIEEYLNNNYDFNQNEFDAIASFIYNIGIHKFSTSTFSRTLESSELRKWVYAKGKYLEGLKARRYEEINLYNTPIYNTWWLQIKDTIYPNYHKKYRVQRQIKG